MILPMEPLKLSTEIEDWMSGEMEFQSLIVLGKKEWR